ncbi:MAG: hypothetical protein K2L17_11655 [Muribaculaceae bacterium]|nr:hypothetical protein [Muribaculaceae bacterium]
MRINHPKNSNHSNKYLSVVAIFLLFSFITISCDREDDELIPQPTETSTTITGYVKTPDGTPLANIPVSFDYFVKGVFGSTVIHKAKGNTDKSGFYKIFFETDETPGMGLHDRYSFSVDLSVLPTDKYIIAEKLDFYIPLNNTEEWSGSTINCNFSIPLKKLVTVKVVNDGTFVKEGKYAVKNMFSYYTEGDFISDGQNLWDDAGKWCIFESTDIPQNGTTSVIIPFAVGVDNAVRVVYHGDSEWGYPNGIPASEGKIIKITNDFNDEIELQYQTPDPNNRWDEF